MTKKNQPTKDWLEKMIKDEKEGIKMYSGKAGYSKQASQERSHLKKLQKKLKELK